jgi:hypothetical protein
MAHCGPVRITGTPRRGSGARFLNIGTINRTSVWFVRATSPHPGPWPGTAPTPLPLPQSGAVLFVGSATIEDSGLFESVRLGYLLFVSWGICFRRWRGGLDRGGGAPKF